MTTIVLAPGLRAQPSPDARPWSFVDATTDAGLSFVHAMAEAPGTVTQRAAGGVAAGDYDRDGDVDLFLVGGDAGSSALLRNRGGSGFDDVTREARVLLEGTNASGPLFFDFDGDAWPDLFVGGTDAENVRLFRNRHDGSFDDVTAKVGLLHATSAVSATAGDYDRDGWLDLFLSHWGTVGEVCHLFRNAQGKSFDCVDDTANIPRFSSSVFDQSFTANFVDIDADDWLDLLVASDFQTSRVLRGLGNGSFEPWNSPVISDENGMGSAIGDYDSDGSLDWFVTGIRDADGTTEGDWGTSGNRLYRNLGDGTFVDTTEAAGVRDGDWGWAACFADLNHDGTLDLVHVNGWPQGSEQFRDTPARLFLGTSSGHFTETGAALGFDERGGGRGLVCFDYDLDGDVDLFVMNNDGPAKLWRNDGGAELGSFLEVALAGPAPNSEGVGAVVRAKANGREQVRTIRAGSNYVSQDPPTAHFGFGSATRVERVVVRWADGVESELFDVRVNRRIVVKRSEPASADSARSVGCSIASSGIGAP